MNSRDQTTWAALRKTKVSNWPSETYIDLGIMKVRVGRGKKQGGRRDIVISIFSSLFGEFLHKNSQNIITGLPKIKRFNRLDLGVNPAIISLTTFMCWDNSQSEQLDACDSLIENTYCDGETLQPRDVTFLSLGRLISYLDLLLTTNYTPEVLYYAFTRSGLVGGNMAVFDPILLMACLGNHAHISNSSILRDARLYREGIDEGLYVNFLRTLTR